MKQRIRIGMGIASALLLLSEILIGMYAKGWVRSYFGDVLVVILLYTLARTVSPDKPKFGLLLPAAILGFAFCVEFLQLWGFCDRFGITNRLLRIIIGTGFSKWDLLSYAIGILPCMLCEDALRAESAVRRVYLHACALSLCGGAGFICLIVFAFSEPSVRHPISRPVSLIGGMLALMLAILTAVLLIRSIVKCEKRGRAILRAAGCVAVACPMLTVLLACTEAIMETLLHRVL